MTNLKALEAIAKDIGKHVANSFDFLPKKGTIYIGDCSNTSMGSQCIQWNPKNNPAQAEEIAMHYKIDVNWNEARKEWEAIYMLWEADKIKMGRGDTPSKATTACAIEIKQQEKQE